MLRIIWTMVLEPNFPVLLYLLFIYHLVEFHRQTSFSQLAKSKDRKKIQIVLLSYFVSTLLGFRFFWEAIIFSAVSETTSITNQLDWPTTPCNVETQSERQNWKLCSCWGRSYGSFTSARKRTALQTFFKPKEGFWWTTSADLYGCPFLCPTNCLKRDKLRNTSPDRLIVFLRRWHTFWSTLHI